MALSFLYSLNLTSIHDHWKKHSLDETDFVGKVMSLFFNILEPSKIKSVTVSTVSPSICYEVMGPDAMILVF